MTSSFDTEGPAVSTAYWRRSSSLKTFSMLLTWAKPTMPTITGAVGGVRFTDDDDDDDDDDDKEEEEDDDDDRSSVKASMELSILISR
eukprot:CAMPEP_0185264910 /NCGR_PEP_ID=MMETSP1359-20130426/25385_1 /TAXON_ID=552665 /ORGANISM="Bigelowiella longifila, Strain CCMP242" /LENGTH=87 /DNA_ID=CAMNT_0027853823 /DNA_START=162 /DNA_END=425 /DNA_ORIENTATION=+